MAGDGPNAMPLTLQFFRPLVNGISFFGRYWLILGW